MDINERLIASGVVPLVQAELPDTAVRISRALLAGGLSVIEVVLRTEKKSASEINRFGDLESVPWQLGVMLWRLDLVTSGIPRTAALPLR